MENVFPFSERVDAEFFKEEIRCEMPGGDSYNVCTSGVQGSTTSQSPH
jgi:hypothetical protein